MITYTSLEIYSPTLFRLNTVSLPLLCAQHSKLRICACCSYIVYMSYRAVSCKKPHSIHIFIFHTHTNKRDFLLSKKRKKENSSFSFNIRFHRYAHTFSRVFCDFSFYFIFLASSSCWQLSVVSRVN